MAVHSSCCLSPSRTSCPATSRGAGQGVWVLAEPGVRSHCGVRGGAGPSTSPTAEVRRARPVAGQSGSQCSSCARAFATARMRRCSGDCMRGRTRWMVKAGAPCSGRQVSPAGCAVTAASVAGARVSPSRRSRLDMSNGTAGVRNWVVVGYLGTVRTAHRGSPGCPHGPVAAADTRPHLRSRARVFGEQMMLRRLDPRCANVAARTGAHHDVDILVGVQPGSAPDAAMRVWLLADTSTWAKTVAGHGDTSGVRPPVASPKTASFIRKTARCDGAKIHQICWGTSIVGWQVSVLHW